MRESARQDADHSQFVDMDLRSFVYTYLQRPLTVSVSDSVQLATALVANDALVTAGFPALVFVAADDDLLAAARGEGLATDNPNRYP